MSKASQKRALKISKGTLKGYLFESILKELIKKAGFDSEFECDQLTKDKKSFHGRGAVHQIDLSGKFCMNIPFIYPILLIGEAKSRRGKVSLADVRNFFGAVMDISQYHKISTKKSPAERYYQLSKPRYTICPVFFSLRGFRKSAEQFMFAQGISFIIYENNPFISQMYNNIEHLIKHVNFDKLTKEDEKKFRDFNLFKKINPSCRKERFDEFLTKLEKQLDRIRSFVGMLNGRYTVNIISKNNKLVSYTGKIRLKRIAENILELRTKDNKLLGVFSLSKHFINYVLKKNEYYENSFSFLDIIINRRGMIKIARLEIEKSAKEKLKEINHK
jgi:hypothetical protein